MRLRHESRPAAAAESPSTAPHSAAPPQQAPYQHDPHTGPPQPAWQGPTQQKKKSKTAWIVAGIVLVVATA